MVVLPKAALAASQADHQETQRRISKLQEVTRGLSIVDFPEHNGTEASQISESGRLEGNVGGVARGAGGEGSAEDQKPCGNPHQLHRMTLVRECHSTKHYACVCVAQR